MFNRGWFWLDRDLAQFDNSIASLVGQYGVARTGHLSEGISELARNPQPWAGLITRYRGRPGELEQLRRQCPTLPVLAIVRQREPGVTRVLKAQRIDIAVLPDDGPVVLGFVRRALATAFLPDERVGNVVDDLATRAALTPRELQIVAYSLADEPRQLMRRRLGITENTFKSQVRALLRKCSEPSLDALTKNILRTAVLLDSSGAKSRVVAPETSLPVAC